MRLHPSLLPLAAALLTGCSEETEDPTPAPPPAADPATAAATYVGGAACTRCHEGDDAAWRGSDHDLAMQPATEENVLGDFDDATFEYAGVTSKLYRGDDGSFRVRTDGPDGELQDFEVRYAFGVVPLQQYLVPFPNGGMQVLPLCWDTRPADKGGQRWFHIYPDEKVDFRDPLHWTGPYQNWDFMCADCHSTALRRDYDVQEYHFNTTWAEIDVSCEACHGPGSRHVAWAEAKERGDELVVERMGLVLLYPGPGTWAFDEGEKTATRVDPQRDEVTVEACGRCHARRTAITAAYDHGHPLLDSHRVALLDEVLYFADGQIEDEVYVYGSFLQSKMYRQGVVCSDCHEPHSAKLRVPGNGLCNRCHDPRVYDVPAHHFHEQRTDGAACVECHMPERNYMVVDPRRDHSIRVPRPDLSVKYGMPNACNKCHDDKDAKWSADAVEDWRAKAGWPELQPHWAGAIDGAWRGKPDSDRALAAVAANKEWSGIVRGTALSMLGRFPSPVSGAALQKGVADEDPMVRFGVLETLDEAPQQQRRDLLLPLLSDPLRLLRAEAARQLADLPDEAIPPSHRSAFERALVEYVEFQLANVDREWAHVNMGLLAQRRGALDDAELEYQHAIRLEPKSVRGWVNLADLYRNRKRDDLGEKLLRRGLLEVTETAPVHHSLGLLLVRKGGAEDEALEHLATASRERQDDPRYAYVHGVALHSLGRVDAALATLEQGHFQFPYDAEFLWALATIARDAEKFDAAERWVREMLDLTPGDQRAQRLLQELRSR